MNLAELHITSAFIAGLFGSLHCVAMCGGIATALGISADSKNSKLMAFLYQLGRITSYALAGAVVAYLGSQISEQSDSQLFKTGLRLVSVLFMTGLGLYLAGWFPRFAQIERIGLPIWRKISPISRRLLPLKKRRHALTLGLLWGWLPCGLVYSILLWSISAPNVASGAAVMLAFGLGTVPAMFAMSLGANQILVVLSQPMVRRIAGITVLSLAIYSLASYMKWL